MGTQNICETVNQASAGHTGIRVCMIAYSVYESDNRVMRYAETLAARGDHVDVIALRQAGQEREGTVQGVNVFRIQSRTFNEKRKARFLLNILLFFLRAMALLSRKQLTQRYDVIHIHSVPDFLVFVAWLPKLMGTKIILDIHDILPEFYASKFQANQTSAVFKILLAIERISAWFADHVVIANDIWRDKLVARSVEERKCTALLNFPDRSLFRREHSARRQKEKFVMLYPGTLNWHQGLDIAIRAMALIKDEVPNAEFHIYGTGRSKDFLVNLTHELGLEERVLFRDALPLRAIARIMESADLGVVCKRTDSFANEAFSTKILEFMSLGVPVIVPDSKVDRFYFDNSLVRFFKSGDESDLAERMLELIRNPGLRQDLANNSLRFVTHNDWNSHKKKYLDIVDSLSKSRPGRTSLAVLGEHQP